MPDEVEGVQAEAEAVEQQAASEATQTNEGATQGGPTSAQNTPSWKVGDTVYTDPNEMYKGFVKWQGDYTRKMQDRAAKDKETTTRMGQYEKVVQAVLSDPQLVQQVKARIQAGQSPQQAVQQTVQQAQQIPPEFAEKLSYLEAKEQEREETASLESFEKSHKDLTDPEWDLMGEWIDSNEDALKGKGWSPSDILEYAFLKTVHPARLQKSAMADLAAKQKGEEAENGKKSAFLGSQAPTAGAKPTGLPERKRGMTPAEERAWAKKVYDASKPKK